MNQKSNINAKYTCAAGAKKIASAHSTIGHQIFFTLSAHSTIAHKVSLRHFAHSATGRPVFPQAIVHSTIGQRFFLHASSTFNNKAKDFLTGLLHIQQVSQDTI